MLGVQRCGAEFDFQVGKFFRIGARVVLFHVPRKERPKVWGKEAKAFAAFMCL